MNYKNVIALIAIGLVGVSGVKAEDPRGDSPYYSIWGIRSCLAWHDGLAISEAIGRIAWARRCAPEYEAYYRYGERQKSKDGMRGPLYPIYGMIDGEGKLRNPRGYWAGVAAPVHDEECDLPLDYTIVGLCPSLVGK